MALQYALSRSAQACVIPGFKNPAQDETNVSAADKPLSTEEIAFVEKQLQG